MTAITFDTLRFVETLETAGIPTAQAKAISSAVRDSTDSADLVTRKDLQIELAPIKAELAAIKYEIEARSVRIEQNILIKVGMMLVAVVGLIVGLLKVL
jgi:hypothetical protein